MYSRGNTGSKVVKKKNKQMMRLVERQENGSVETQLWKWKLKEITAQCSAKLNHCQNKRRWFFISKAKRSCLGNQDGALDHKVKDDGLRYLALKYLS